MGKWKAVATLDDGEREWDVVIYSDYESEAEAMEGARRFLDHGYPVKAVEIRRTP